MVAAPHQIPPQLQPPHVSKRSRSTQSPRSPACQREIWAQTIKQLGGSAQPRTPVPPGQAALLPLKCLPSPARLNPALIPPVLSSMSPLPSPKFTAWAYKVRDASSNPAEIACDPKPRNIALVMKRDEKFRAVINSCKEMVWFPCRLRSGGCLNMTGTWLNCLGPRLFKAQNHTVQFVVLICSC